MAMPCSKNYIFGKHQNYIDDFKGSFLQTKFQSNLWQNGLNSMLRYWGQVHSSLSRSHSLTVSHSFRISLLDSPSILVCLSILYDVCYHKDGLKRPYDRRYYMNVHPSILRLMFFEVKFVCMEANTPLHGEMIST